MNVLERMHFVSFSSSFPRRNGEERRLPNKPQLSRGVMDVFRLDSWKTLLGLTNPSQIQYYLHTLTQKTNEELRRR